ncbi:MAG TPA: hypothetical protein VGV12_01200 [Gemmatimonadales bacterium]|nr:hypothetical protein [Gemmatimonadales bacterium]
MGTFLSSALALAALLQAPVPGGSPDSVAALRDRAERDSTDARLWLLMGRAYLELGADAHGPGHRPVEDSAWARAMLDTADVALSHAAALAGPLGASAAGDSARVLRVGAWAARSWSAWEAAGIEAGQQALGPLPTDLRLPAVLEELGENLLRACPKAGVLMTASGADSYAAWYMRFARNLRPDLLVLPLATWREDAPLRSRLMRDLKLTRKGDTDPWLRDLVRRRPVCVSMGFDRPPETRPRLAWQTRTLLWVAGAGAAGARVPPRDFVFAALRVALDGNDPWAEPALAAYTRAARTTPGLCEAMATFKVASEVASCRR